LNTNLTSASPSGIDASSVTLQPGNRQLSPFAKLLSTLEQLSKSDPTKYVQVTQQIATNRKNAAQTAQSEGLRPRPINPTSSPATSRTTRRGGQLPNIQDLALAVGGHHHHVQAASGRSGWRWRFRRQKQFKQRLEQQRLERPEPGEPAFLGSSGMGLRMKPRTR
jgi:hypothetical protein